MIYVLGFLESSLYKCTTSYKVSMMNNFTFVNSLKDLNISNNDILIRYGVDSYSSKDVLFHKVVNRAESIKKSKDKLFSSLLFKQYNIPIPEIFIDISDLKKKSFPVLRRLKFHSRGSDISFIRSKKDIVPGDYYSKFIKSDLEYRIHVFDNEVIRIQKKIPKKGTKKQFVHNFENGYLLVDNFEHNIPLETNLIPLSIRCVQLLGLDFGAVDILISKDYKPYVLEVNSAPRLNRYGRELYSFYFKQFLGIENPMFNYSRLRNNEGKYSNGLPIRFRDLRK
jgi:glutathione synthase/RimK-type ligase-like ATP-grasp enzyme